MIPTIQPSQQIQLKYIFGLNSSIRNNLYFIDDQRIIFPAGYHIICYSTADKSQTYFQGIEGYKGFSCMTLSPMKRFLAVGGKADKPAIFIYDTMSQKKKRTLIFHEVPIKEWVSLAFGPGVEAKTLVSLSGGQGEAVVCYWQIDTMKCLAWAKVTQNAPEIFEVSFNPNDVSFISCVGKNIFKCFRFQAVEGDTNTAKGFTLRCLSNILVNAPAEISQHFTCHAWMNNVDHFVVATGNGELLVCDEQGDYQISLKNCPKSLFKNDIFIEVIMPTSKGFIVGGENAMIYIYNYNGQDQDSPYEMVKQLHVKSISEFKVNQIKGIALTPLSEERIIVTLSSNLIYSFKLRQENTFVSEHEQQFELVSLPNHSGPINGMDICVRKPLIVTCGVDKFIRIWNYEEKTIETYKSFNEEAYCVSFHPSGFHIVVGLSDRLRLMNICVHNNQIKHYREIVPFRACKEIKFSNGGQYFAAVNGTNSNQLIHVYRFYTVDNPPNLIFKGHTGRIRCIAWSKDDTILASCGADGMICAWKIGSDSDGQRKIDVHQKQINFSCVTLTNDARLAYGVGSDRSIREMTMDGTELRKNVDVMISQLAFPNSNKILFAGICDDQRSSGAIRCYKYPLTGSSGGAFVEYQAHDERGVEKLRVTSDDQYLISAGRDGVIIIYEIKDKDARGIKYKEGFSKAADEILVSRPDLDDLKSTKDALKMQQTDLNAQSNMINLTGKEDLIKQLQEKLVTTAQQSRQNYESLLEKKREFEKKFAEDIKHMKDEFEAEIQDLDTNYQKKVMQEVGKYEDLKRQQEIENNGYQKKVTQMQQEHNTKVRQLEEEYESLLQDEATQRERVQKDIKETTVMYKATIKQIESETQDEIKSLEEKNQQQILQVTDSGLKAKSEVSMHKKKISAQQMEAQKLEDQQKEFKEQRKQLKEQNEELKEAIDEQKKQINERDKTIGEKERKIYELKKRSQELEKFKFVLDHKIKELKRDIGPREDEISRMKDETNRMDQRLKKFNAFNNTLGTVVDELDTAQIQMKDQIKDQRAYISYQNVRIKQFKDDVYQAVQFIQNYDELKKHCEKLYKEYVNKDVQPVVVDDDISKEYSSQKNYLEKSVRMLKKNLSKDDEIHKQDNIRIMRENVELIKEINKLRKQIKEIKFSQKGSDKGDTPVKSTKEKKNDQSELNNTGEIKDNKTLQDKRKKLLAQRQEMTSMQNNIDDLESELQILRG